MTLTHRLSTAGAGATTNGPGTGLDCLWTQVGSEMNRLGMLADPNFL